MTLPYVLRSFLLRRFMKLIAVLETNPPNEQIWQPMNSYQFQPISPPPMNTSHPIPVSHRPNSINPNKRNSTIRSSGFPRSITSDHLSTPPSTRLFTYPSVQDVLNALNQRSFEKESYV